MLKVITKSGVVVEGKLVNFEPTPDEVVFNFVGGCEVRVKSRSDAITARLRAVGLKTVQNAEVNFATGIVTIRDAKVMNKPIPGTPRPENITKGKGKIPEGFVVTKK